MPSTEFMTSPITGRTVPANAYSPTAVLDAYKAESPATYAAALAGGPPPTMFAGGDLPAFLASGLDPQVLLSFPVNQRHAVAAMPDTERVYYLSQEYAGDPSQTLPHDAWDAYLGEVRHWLTTSGTGNETEDSIEKMHEQIFGEQERYRAAQEKAKLDRMQSDADAAAQRVADAMAAYQNRKR